MVPTTATVAVELGGGIVVPLPTDGFEIDYSTISSYGHVRFSVNSVGSNDSVYLFDVPIELVRKIVGGVLEGIEDGVYPLNVFPVSECSFKL